MPTKKFMKGEINNPHGRPKLGTSITEALRYQMQTMSMEELVNMKPANMLEEMVRKQLIRAGNDTKAFEVVADRVEGKPVQKIEHSEARPIVFDSSLEEKDD